MTFSTDTTRREAFDQAVRDGMAMAHVPSRYMDVDPVEFPEGKPWVYITGSVGSGKTHLACGILRGHIKRRTVSAHGGDFWFPPRCSFVTASGYLAEVKKGFDGYGMASTYKNSPFLVIDDLGQEVPTQWAVAELFDLFNHRYSEERATVITSQFSRGAIARRLAANGGEEQALAIASRLAEECTVIDLGRTDRRVG